MQPVPWVWTVSMRREVKTLLPIVGYQNIGDSFTLHMPALDQHGLGAAAEDQVGGMAHIGGDIEISSPLSTARLPEYWAIRTSTAAATSAEERGWHPGRAGSPLATMTGSTTSGISAPSSSSTSATVLITSAL